jgi:hypothetical protein
VGVCHVLTVDFYQYCFDSVVLVEIYDEIVSLCV